MCDGYLSSVEELLTKNKSFRMHHEKMRFLAIEIHESLKGQSSEVSVRKLIIISSNAD